MGVGDVVQRVVKQGPEGPVHCAQRASQPAPLLRSEVRHEHVGMLQVGDEHEMVVDDHVREQIEAGHGGESEAVDAEAQQRHSEEEGHIGLHDEPVLFRLEEGSSRREVVGILPSVLGGTSGVEHQVAGKPSYCEHDEDAPHLCEGALSEHLVGPVRTSGRGEHLVILTRAGVVVVQAVGDAPRVVRDQQQRVADGSHDVVGELTLREGLMATFMCQDPHSCQDAALSIPVDGPKDVSRPCRQ